MAQLEVCTSFSSYDNRIFFRFEFVVAKTSSPSFAFQTLLKILSRSVACLDEVHHHKLLRDVSFFALHELTVEFKTYLKYPPLTFITFILSLDFWNDNLRSQA